MKMNLSNLMFMMMITITILITLSSNNILLSWTMMEINFISFIPLISKSNKINEQIMKYFIIQSMASSILILSMMLKYLIELPLATSILMMISLMIKIGLMPTHIWMPMIMKELSWNNCLIMMTMQKIIPIVITCQMINTKNLNPMMQLSMLISPMSAMNQTSMKKLMSYSSINNSPWMIMAMNYSSSMFLMFMLSYSIINTYLMNLLKKMNMIYINQMKLSSNKQNMMILIMMLTMVGIPPTLGFLTKWMILQEEMMNSIMNTISMIMSSMMMTFVYMQMMNKTLLKYSTFKKMNNDNKMMNESMVMNLMGMMMMIYMINLN